VLGNNGNREALVLGEIKPGIGNDCGIPSHEQRENVGIDEDLRESHECDPLLKKLLRSTAIVSISWTCSSDKPS